MIWATSLENLFMPYANNKGADQPAHPSSLISTFVLHCLGGIIHLGSISEISSLHLAFVAAQAGLCRKPCRQVFSWRSPYYVAEFFFLFSSGELKGEGRKIIYSALYANLGGHYIHNWDRRVPGGYGILWTRHVYIVQVSLQAEGMTNSQVKYSTHLGSRQQDLRNIDNSSSFNTLHSFSWQVTLNIYIFYVSAY